jgi:hypothetical protein
MKINYDIFPSFLRERWERVSSETYDLELCQRVRMGALVVTIDCARPLSSPCWPLNAAIVKLKLQVFKLRARLCNVLEIFQSGVFACIGRRCARFRFVEMKGCERVEVRERTPHHGKEQRSCRGWKSVPNFRIFV